MIGKTEREAQPVNFLPYDEDFAPIEDTPEPIAGTIMRQPPKKEWDCPGARPMSKLPFLLAPFFAVWLILPAPSAVLAAPDCTHWAEKGGVDWKAVHTFWALATPGDVARCLKAGADLEARSKLLGYTPLHWAARSGKAGTVTALLKAGADLEAQSKDGYTPLHWAAELGNVDAVTALLKAGADLEARSKDGYTPLHRAARSGKASSVTALSKAGADLEARSKLLGYTPLHDAAFFGKAGTVTALLKAGANPKTRDKLGRRPIDLADKEGKLTGPAYWRLLFTGVISRH